MKINKLSPNFEVRSISETVLFYQENFGFELLMAVPESQDGIEQTLSEEKDYVYAMVQKDRVELMFQRSDSFKHDVPFSKDRKDRETGASVSFYMEVEGIEDFYQSLKSKNLSMTLVRNE